MHKLYRLKHLVTRTCSLPASWLQAVFKRNSNHLQQRTMAGWIRLISKLLSVLDIVWSLAKQQAKYKRFARILDRYQQVSNLNLPKALPAYPNRPDSCIHDGPMTNTGNTHGKYRRCDLCGQRWVMLNKSTVWQEQPPLPFPGAKVPAARRGTGGRPSSSSSSTAQPKAKAVATPPAMTAEQIQQQAAATAQATQVAFLQSPEFLQSVAFASQQAMQGIMAQMQASQQANLQMMQGMPSAPMPPMASTTLEEQYSFPDYAPMSAPAIVDSSDGSSVTHEWS